MHQLKN